MKEMTRPTVGVFDSGVGGLTVLRECVRQIPEARFLYLGDNARAPYGSRPPEVIVSFVREALEKFQRRGVNATLLACNTATAVAADQVRKEFSFPIVGTEPAVAPAARVCRNVLILCTPRTAESPRLRALVARFPQTRFTVSPAPRLAGEIERFLTRGESLTLSDHLPGGNFDGVVLGCTHYVFFREEIASFYRAPVFDGNEGTAKRLRALLPLKKIGTGDHLCSEQNPNMCLTKKYSLCPNKGIIFLGEGAKINRSVFFSNVCFT
ncbi:MAG: glutamate racemase [Candidatus Gallimonas sp.]